MKLGQLIVSKNNARKVKRQTKDLCNHSVYLDGHVCAMRSVDAFGEFVFSIWETIPFIISATQLIGIAPFYRYPSLSIQ